jgi:hypothetical protein
MSVLNRDPEFNWALSPGMAPLKLLWGAGDRVRSFVMQGGASLVGGRIDGSKATLDILLPGACDVEDRNACREVAFYLDVQGTPRMTLDGQPTNTFRPGECVSLQDDLLELQLSVDADQATGDYVCHLQRANRPAERETTFPGQDWAIYVRTLRRQDNARLRVTLNVVVIQQEGREDVTVGAVEIGN